jgi:hypothetical protein
MRYEYKLTYQDYKDAQKLYLKSSWKAALSHYFWIWAVPIVGCILALPLIATLLGFRSEWFESMAGFGGAGLWFAIFIPAMRIYTVRKCWKRLLPENARKSVRTEISAALEWNEEQLISILPGRSEGRFFWSALVDFVENDKLVLIFIKKKMFLFIPKDALPVSAWEDIRSHWINRPVGV